MPYKLVFHYPDGTIEEEDELYETEDQADEAGLYGCSCFNEGGEVLHLSNPGEYPNDSIESECDYEIIEVDD